MRRIAALVLSAQLVAAASCGTGGGTAGGPHDSGSPGASPQSDASTSACGATATASTSVTISLFHDRSTFEGVVGHGCLSTIDFDDVNTSTGARGITADRYAVSYGVILEGRAGGGQFVDRDFGKPEDFVATSSPNVFAPGPKPSPTDPTGGKDTDVRFVSGGAPALVSAVAVVFLDADTPSQGPSSLAVLGPDGKTLFSTQATGADQSQVFVGMVALDELGAPIRAIAGAHVVNGSGWAGLGANEVVALDDLMFTVH